MTRNLIVRTDKIFYRQTLIDMICQELTMICQELIHVCYGLIICYELTMICHQLHVTMIML